MPKNKNTIKTVASLTLLLSFVVYTMADVWEKSGNYYYRDILTKGKVPPDYPGAGIFSLFYLFNKEDEQFQLVCSQARSRLLENGDPQFQHFAAPLKDFEVREMLVTRFKVVWENRYGISEQQTRVLIYQGCDWVVYDLYSLYECSELVSAGASFFYWVISGKIYKNLLRNG